ncbi:hypothetical protein [Dactylosporangium sp. NPDC051541]|uniref:hypothetical protein n=1 Tax=Dactylosporangium sp. NPDC051541 TaxID=3363977 RepID=UPI0037AA3815
MTTPQGQPLPPVVPVALTDDLADDPDRGDGIERDAEDGTPVGQSDQRADVERAGGDPDEV